MANTSILIKRSLTTGIPGSLAAGEFAYSYASNTLFIGSPTGNGVVNVGGQYYTSTIDQATAANTALALVRRDTNGTFAGRLTGIADKADQLTNARNFSISGTDITAGTQSFDGSGNVVLNAALNAVPGLTAGTYGSTTEIPSVTVGANGRILAITTNSVATNLDIAGDTGTDAVDLLTDTLTFTGGVGITSTVGTNSVTFDVDNTVVRANTPVNLQTIDSSLTINGNLTVLGTQTTINTNTLNVADPMIYLAANNTVGDAVDIGFAGTYNDGTQKSSGVFRNAGNKEFYVFDNYDKALNSNNEIDVADSSFHVANLHANLISGFVNATQASIGTLTLDNALAVTSGGTGTTTSTGTGSVVLNTNPTFNGILFTPTLNATTIHVETINVTTLNVTTVNVTAVTANSINIGTLTYPASGAFVAFGSNANNYQQVVIQNANNGTQASADFVVSNDISTDGEFYGDFGINSSGFTGVGALNAANNVYLYSHTTDLVVGTATANAIHFVVDSGATDAMTISALGEVTLGTALGVPSGGTGRTTFNQGSIIIGNDVGGLLTLANTSYVVTGTGAANNTVTSMTFDAYGRATAATYSPISGLTVGQGGTGVSSFTTNGITYGNGTGAIQITAAAGDADQTWSNQILTTTNAGVPVWSTALDGGTF